MSQDSTTSFTVAIPLDDIDIQSHHLKRDRAVKDVIDLATKHTHVVMGASPASGKTSLLRLIQEQLKKRGALVIKLALRKHRSVGWAFQHCKGKGIDFDDEDELTKLNDAWILLDDAQNWYAEEYWSFWQTLVKDTMSAKGKLFFIFSTTYDLTTPDSPVDFGSLEHFSRLSITSAEAHELFLQWVPADFDHFLQMLKKLSSTGDDQHHIGVIMAGLRLLQSAKKTVCRDFNDETAVAALRSGDFTTFLKRCYALPENLPEHGRVRIVQTILHGNVESKVDDVLLRPYIRAGVLGQTGDFACLAATWFYNRNCFPRRAFAVPSSLDDLVRLSVASLSSSRLRRSFVEGFPKEAAFQHFFNEAMSEHLTIDNFLIPEFNTWATDSSGEEISGELDFYINGQLQWCLELLRMGDKIGEHLARFHPHEGKYREVESKEFLVVDCQGPKSGHGARIDEDRCTLYFEEDFTKCRVQMRTNSREEFIDLKP